MKLPTKLVAVKKISSNVARSSFPPEDIEKAAHLITKVEGTINPIILKRTSLESYEVVDGNFEYYAAVRAREISPLKGEMIQAIILEPENEESLLEQVDLLRNRGSELNPTETDQESWFVHLEQIFNSQFEELRKDNRNLERSIAEIESKVQNSGFGDELIDRIVKRIVEAVSPEPDDDEFPLDLNSASKDKLTKVPNIGTKKASLIVDRRNTQGNFTSVEELSEIRGITRRMIKINQWHKYLVVNS